MDKLRLSWDEVYDQSLKLAKLIEDDSKKAGEMFDYLVVVPRGGYFPANIVARKLGFGVKELLHANVGSYKEGVNNRSEDIAIGEMPDIKTIENKNLLIIDEVCDSGYTLKYLVDHFKKQNAALVRSGVLHYKPKHSKTGYKPDWSVAITDHWVIYPWEVNEHEHNI